MQRTTEKDILNFDFGNPFKIKNSLYFYIYETYLKEKYDTNQGLA